jgi:aspartokinase/homoserine dehydrogenase 1
VLRFEVHAIDGSMIIAPDGLKKLLTIRRQIDKEGSVFVIAPVCEGLLELQSLLEAAKVHDERLWAMTEERLGNWTTLVENLVDISYQDIVLLEIKESFSQFEDILKAVWLVGDASTAASDFIDIAVGRWVALIFEKALVKEGYSVKIENIKTFLDFNDFILEEGQTILLTGKLPQSPSLSRECGAEYAASVVANKISGSLITYWNQELMVTTADINDVPSAAVIDAITYSEATELSFFGSPVIRPQNMVPALAKKIPLRLRSFNQVEHLGTLIDDTEGTKDHRPVKGFSVTRGIALINVEGAGMIGVPGIASRLFEAMQQAEISVVLISQASSEYSICYAVPAEQAALAKAIARSTFINEIESNRIHNIEAEMGCAILAAVGENMIGVPGIAATFFNALGKARVNVRAIAQGSSERNISAVIKETDSRRALRALHAGFFLSNQTLSVGIFGPGNIGGTLLDQIADEAVRLKNEFGVDIRIRAIANSKKMLLDEMGIDLSSWRKNFEQKSIELDLEKLVKYVSASYFPHAVLIDCTSSTHLPEHYVDWIERGIHIITPNKRAGTAAYPKYEKLMNAGRHYGKHFLYETTVGAGLPVIGTLKDLIQTGDRVKSVEGIVSGTLAYLFSSYDGSQPFSTLVKSAKESGYTEPDPRDDLSGMDVARKTIILAREMGYKVELEDIDVFSLVPKELEDVSLSEFMERMDLMDNQIATLYKEAEKQEKKLCYVGRITESGQCQVELASYPKNHPFSQSKGTDNVVAFTTERYYGQPLVIQGPGAGPEVTAGGVFADLLRLSSYLGARL